MRRLQQLLILPLAGLALAGCQQSGDNQTKNQENQRDQTVLAGKITNAGSPRATILVGATRGTRTKQQVQLDSTGFFETRLSVEKPVYLVVRAADQEARAYLEPTDSLYLQANADQLKNSLTFSGTPASINNYLAAKARLADSVNFRGQSTVMDLYKRNPAAFQQAVDSVQQAYMTHFLNTFDEDAPQPFARLEKASIRSQFHNKRMRYPRAYKQIAEDPQTPIPDSITDFAYANIPTDDPLLVRAPHYMIAVSRLLRQERQAMKQRHAFLKDTARGYVFKVVLDSMIANKRLKAQMTGRLLQRQIKRQKVSDIKPLYEYYQQIAYEAGRKKRVDSLMAERRKITPGKKAPGFTYPSHSGDTVSLADLEGQYVYVDAWATWCGPCVREIPKLKALHEDMKDQNIAFVSISMDEAEDRQKWASMVEDRNLKGYQLFANGEAFDSQLAQNYLINSIPRFIIIDPEGRIVDPNAERPSQGVQKRLEELVSSDDIST